jgi:hypothetical protein
LNFGTAVARVEEAIQPSLKAAGYSAAEIRQLAREIVQSKGYAPMASTPRGRPR